MIPLVKEPPDEPMAYWGIERCHFCNAQTAFWHENTNNPVCPKCAAKHKVGELPDFGQKIRTVKRKKKRGIK
jgi:hypothetical protein